MITAKVVGFEEAQPKSVPIGIVVAVQVELDAILDVLQPLTSGVVLKVMWAEAVYYVGRLGVYDCVVTMCKVGSGGPGGSTLATSALVERWGVSFLIMPGIAFGRKKKGQVLGDVLVAAQVINYEVEKKDVGRDVSRGDRPPSGLMLFNRARVAPWEWSPRPGGPVRRARTGPLLSGDKLVNNPVVVKELFERYPDAIGGEMEATGVFAGAAFHGLTEWIVAKAVCDWADGKKHDRAQPLAARNSAAFVGALLSETGLLDRRGVSAGIGRALDGAARLQESLLMNDAIRGLRAERERHEGNLGVFQQRMESGASREVLRAEVARLRSSFERLLTAYDDACHRALRADVPFDSFISHFGEEIVQLVEAPPNSITQGFLPPRGDTFDGLWTIYLRLRRPSP